METHIHRQPSPLGSEQHLLGVNTISHINLINDALAYATGFSVRIYCLVRFYRGHLTNLCSQSVTTIPCRNLATPKF